MLHKALTPGTRVPHDPTPPYQRCQHYKHKGHNRREVAITKWSIGLSQKENSGIAVDERYWQKSRHQHPKCISEDADGVLLVFSAKTPKRPAIKSARYCILLRMAITASFP